MNDEPEEFPLRDGRDTERNPHPPEEESEMPEPTALQKAANAPLTIDEKLDVILQGLLDIETRQLQTEEWQRKTDERLKEGDGEFKEQRKDIGIVCASVKALCEVRGLDEKVQELGARLAERFPTNGAGHSEHDVPTNPENGKPLPDAE